MINMLRITKNDRKNVFRNKQTVGIYLLECQFHFRNVSPAFRKVPFRNPALHHLSFLPTFHR